MQENMEKQTHFPNIKPHSLAKATWPNPETNRAESSSVPAGVGNISKMETFYSAAHKKMNEIQWQTTYNTTVSNWQLDIFFHYK